jgi:hypothetical protein
MAELMIVLLGFCGVINGLEKLSMISFNHNMPRITGLLASSALQTAGSTMAVLCIPSGNYSMPLVMLLAGIVVWGLSDRRGHKRGIPNGS